jgi:AraC-like DNA-binding protein
MESIDPKALSLSSLERRALEALCTETFAGRAPVDAISFRADHEGFRPAIRRLCQLRYVDEDNSSQTYVPTVLGLKEVGSADCVRVLNLGTTLLNVFREHYRSKAKRKTNLLLKDLSLRLGIERTELNFSMWLLASFLNSTLAGRSTNLDDEDAYVLPGEAVYDYPSVDSIIAIYEGYRDQALQSTYALPRPSSSPPTRQPTEALFERELVDRLPQGIRQVIAEIDVAVSIKLTCLAVMGLRAVLDIFATELVGGDMGGFQQKIRLLKEKKLLHDRQIEILEAALEVGHAAAHRMHVPSDDQCRQVLGIVAHLLREHYLLAPDAKKLKDSAPQRERQK